MTTRAKITRLSGLALVLLGLVLASPLQAAELVDTPQTLLRTNSSSFLDILIEEKLVDEKPAVFPSWGARLDYLHENLSHGLVARTEEMDLLFSDKSIPVVAAKQPSRFRMGMYASIKKDRDFEFKFAPEFSADVDLPNVEARWSVFIDTRGNDELPGVDPIDRDSGAQIGVTKKSDRFPIRWKTGVKADVPPEVFTKLEWRELWKAGDWSFMPYLNAYVDTSEGFGQLTSLSTYSWFGRHKDCIIKTTTAGIWGDDFPDYQVEQSFGLGRVTQFIEDRHAGGNAKRDEAGRGYGCRYSAFGHVGESSTIERHRFTLMYRWPIYKTWLFAEILPEVEWREEDDWDVIPSLKIGFDALLWGI